MTPKEYNELLPDGKKAELVEKFIDEVSVPLRVAERLRKEQKGK